MKMRTGTLAFVTAAGMAMGAQAQPSFTGLGGLPGGSEGSRANGVSADGRVVVGTANGSPGTTLAFTWTAAAGMVALPILDGAPGIYRGQAISGDGQVAVGVAMAGSAYRASNWQSGDEPAYLPGATNLSTATSVSYDGSVVAGRQGGNQAAIWTVNGIMELGNLPGATSSFAHAVSADGQVVVGRSAGLATSGAFRWTDAGGMQPIGSPSDTYRLTVAYSVSADGQTLGGGGDGLGGAGAAIWTEGDGVTMLGPRPAGTYGGWVSEMSADAGVLGINALQSGTGRAIAVLWTPGRGQELLSDVLTQRCGLDLTGWHLSEVGGISADGRTIVGTGVHEGVTEAFVAVLCEPVVCPAEYNGALAAGDILDFLDFLQDFAECTNLPAPCGQFGDPDINRDLTIDILDFLDFMEAFGEGC